MLKLYSFFDGITLVTPLFRKEGPGNVSIPNFKSKKKSGDRTATKVLLTRTVQSLDL